MNLTDFTNLTNCICSNTRPNVHKLSEKQLLDIIMQWDGYWYNGKHTRADMVDKVFQLWSDREISNDITQEPITCLICWDNLTNGNNMSFPCGHKFHSTCIVKSVLVHSTNTYINYLDDNEKQSVSIDFNCPQCKQLIDCVGFSKSNPN